MPLSNAQYDEIMHEYDERQLHNRHILETRPCLWNGSSSLLQAGIRQTIWTRFIPVRIAKTAGISTGKNATVLNRQLSIPSMPSPTFAKYSVLKILTISATIFIRKRKKIR